MQKPQRESQTGHLCQAGTIRRDPQLQQGGAELDKLTARAKYVVILGPDGSGKTTIANGLADVLADEFAVRRNNFTFGIMPSISRVLGRAERKSTHEGQRGSGMVHPLERNRAIILAVWYGLDHLMGHLALRKTENSEIVIFARSYHDFLYQRAYLNLPKAIPRFFLKLGPKPDLLLVPVRDPDIVHEQKPELTAKEIAEQYSRITAQMSRISYYVKIDASGGIDETISRCRMYLGL